MYKPNILIPDNLDLVNRSKSATRIPQVLFIHGLGQAPNKDIPRSIVLRYGHLDGWRDIGRFTPADFELLPM